MKKIMLLATGGTLACAMDDGVLTPLVDANSFLKYIPEYKDFCEIDAVQIFNIGSTSMQPEHWIEIGKTVEKYYSKYDGFVITHGTDTMAYTSAALSYMFQYLNKPVVITGAQKPIEAEGTDAVSNLIDSIRFACEGIGGVFIVFNRRVINGTRAVKIRSKSYDAFHSINYPYIAAIQDGNIKLLNGTGLKKCQEETNFKTSLCTDVFLLKLIPGTKPQLFDYLKTIYKGVVIETFGCGGMPFGEKRNLLVKIKDMIDAGVVVVITTQCLEEGCDLTIYKVGKATAQYPIISAHDMNSEAAVTKLMWVLGQTQNIAEAKKMFLTPMYNDITI
ncbi:asparaginase [Petroclostridium sp. X23]|uniref:asparaginase n=1 Tax=Petroclostridium sp. X23 TaxID=3045146 RepID=UPI0024ADA687|nr:asparaginase [Petroclostridium sp. X23]WHH58228.1 asparaginase [Petroclostridium sp. X23]